VSFNNMVTSRHRGKSVRRRLFQVFFSGAWTEIFLCCVALAQLRKSPSLSTPHIDSQWLSQSIGLATLIDAYRRVLRVHAKHIQGF